MISRKTAGMLLCVSGEAKLLVNDSNYQFTRGSLCFISPIIHIEMLSSSEDCEWELLSDVSDNFYSITRYAFDTIMNNNLFKNPCLQLDEEQIGKFMGFLETIEEKKQKCVDVSVENELVLLRHSLVLLEQVAMADFLVLYFHNHVLMPQKVSRNEKVAYDFINRLNHNYSTERSVGWYAEKANLTSNYFSQIVHYSTGYTPSEWIKKITIANAKILLSAPNISVNEVSEKLNFPEQFTFRKYFKQYTGMSPRQYQKSLRGGVKN